MESLKDKTKKIFGERLKAALDSAGIKQYRLAELLNVLPSLDQDELNDLLSTANDFIASRRFT